MSDWASPSRKRKLRKEVAKRDGEACRNCGATGVELVLDHIVGRGEGGTNLAGNLQLLCRPCNSAKGNRGERTVRFASSMLQAGFCMVPNLVVDRDDLSPVAQRVYALLTRFARQDESCFPGQSRLTELVGVSERTMRAGIRELEDTLLVRTQRRGMGKTNRYVLLDPRVQEAAESTDASTTDRQILPITPDRQMLPNGSANTAGHDRQILPVLKDYADAVNTDAVDPPCPPRGKRKTDLKVYEERLTAYAAWLLPDTESAEAVPVLNGALRGGITTTGALLDWLEKWHPDLVAGCPRRP